MSDLARVFDASPNAYLLRDGDLASAAANCASLGLLRRELCEIVGCESWHAFPAGEETQRRAIAPFEAVQRTGKPDTLALWRFDVSRAEQHRSDLEKRYRSIARTPVLDDEGSIAFVLHHPIDVTALQTLPEADERGVGEWN